MSHYNVVLAQPENYPFVLALREAAMLLHFSLESLGLQSALRTNTIDPTAVNILVGYHVAGDLEALVGRDIVIYQLEQLSENEGWFSPQRQRMLQIARSVWDYSAENVSFLCDKGLRNVRYLPFGFHERLRTIRTPPNQDIDVLFYGTMNERRHQLVNALAKHCQLTVLNAVYGEERDSFIARSKIILNLHFYEAKIMEQARISYLLNNGRFVVSEDSPYNPFEGMIVTAPYERLIDTRLHYLRSEQERIRIAQRGVELFRKRPMVEHVRRVLAV